MIKIEHAKMSNFYHFSFLSWHTIVNKPTKLISKPEKTAGLSIENWSFWNFEIYLRNWPIWLARTIL
jgi:hypothetical protein